MKRPSEMDEKELYYYLKETLNEKLFEEIYGDWTLEKDKIKQLSLFEDSESK